MSTNTLERVLYLLTVDRESKHAFRDDPAKFLSRFGLDQREREMVTALDVRGLADCGVNPMLTMGLWLEHEGSRNVDGYLVRMRAPQGGAFAPVGKGRAHG